MKILKKEIKYCNECPYCEYDAYYDCARDSGYNCKLVDKRIIDDSSLNKNEYIKIPDWCPLPDLNNNDNNEYNFNIKK